MERLERVVNGISDPRFRLSVNLLEVPALRLKDFKDYKPDFILGQDAPLGREAQGPERGEVVAIPRVGGLHNRYERRAA